MATKDNPLQDDAERREFAAEHEEIASMAVLIADLLEEGARGEKCDVEILRYSDAGFPIMQFEDGTEYEIVFKRTK